jgi:methionyl aminopeptidase
MAEKTQVELYSLKELDKIKRACDVVVEVLETVAEHVKPGVSTFELDLIARDVVKKRGARSAFLNYKPPFSKVPYPAALCVFCKFCGGAWFAKKGAGHKRGRYS